MISRKALKALNYNAEQIKDIESFVLGERTLKNSPAINHENLKTKGFTEEIINKIEENLKDTFDIKFVFNKWTIGSDFCENVLNIDKSDLENPSFDLLSTIGFKSAYSLFSLIKFSEFVLSKLFNEFSIFLYFSMMFKN